MSDKRADSYKRRNKPTGKGRYKQGYYKPQNPQKYSGDASLIIYRSSWEHKFCSYCDNASNVTSWGSEPFHIRYYNPITQKPANYYIDFFMKIKKKDRYGDEYTETILVEVKPKGKLIKPRLVGNKTVKKKKQYEYLAKEYLINEAKFMAAKNFAEKTKSKFMIITEDFF